MCHAFLSDSRFHQLLFRIDQEIAAEVQAGGCSCGGVLHSARYPRKPRGLDVMREESGVTRLSFCCALDGCRRRTTPPSVRFLGRKVYSGAMVILLSALQHGLSPRRRQWLIETLDIWPQTLSRWRKWWQQTFPASHCWQSQRGNFMPPLADSQLPGALLGRLTGSHLQQRLCQLLVMLMPVSTASCQRYLPVVMDPQKM